MTELRFVVRRLVAAPGFLCAAVVTLALGIGANTLTFSAIRGLLLRPLPFPDADRLVWVHGVNTGTVTGGERISGDEADALAAPAGAFESIGLIGDRALVRESGGRPSQWHGLWVTTGVLPSLRLAPAAGRTFDERDMARGPAPAMMLGYERWQRDFGGDPSVVGQVLRFSDNKAHTVIGVLPRSLEFPFGPMPQAGNGSGLVEGVQDFWVLGQGRADELPGGLMMARLCSGASAEGAARDALAVAKVGRAFTVVTMRDQALGMLRPALPLLQGFAAFVLLIACVNLANLTLARAAKGRQEFAVRAALGPAPAIFCAS